MHQSAVDKIQMEAFKNERDNGLNGICFLKKKVLTV